MITIDELSALADKLQAMSHEKKEQSSMGGIKDVGYMGEAVGLNTACVEVWKFINEHQLKTLS